MSRRVIIVPGETAGFGSRLAQGFRSSGVSCTFVDLGADPFSYRDRAPRQDLGGWTRKIRSRAKTDVRWQKWFWQLLSAVLAFGIAIRVLRPSTLYICLGGFSLVRKVDMLYARAIGATVVSVFLGSDSRPPFLNGFYINAIGDSHEQMQRLSRQVRRHVQMSERFSTYVVCNPCHAHFLTKPFLDWYAMGMPCEDVIQQVVDREFRGTRRLKIVHAPSRPKEKGTSKIESALRELEHSGLDFNFVLLTGVSNQTVLAELADADLIIDELYSDLFIAGVGTEGSRFGTPYVTFGYCYAREQAIGHNHCIRKSLHSPEKIVSVLGELISNASHRRALAQCQQEFVRSWESQLVARKYLRLQESTPDPEAVVSPDEVSYILGWGISQDELRAYLQSLLTSFGLADLGINDEAPSSQILENFISRA